MDILKANLIITTAGATYVNSPGGFSLQQIVAVYRTGLQYDKVNISDLNNGGIRQWAYQNYLKRIRFPSSLPFISGEKVLVITKVTS
jgi:hypothetical protein